MTFREVLIHEATRLIDEHAGVVLIAVGWLTTAKQLVRYYAERYGEGAVYLICSENSESLEAQAFIQDINNRLPGLRVFIFTSSLGSGVDITCRVRAVCGVFG